MGILPCLVEMGLERKVRGSVIKAFCARGAAPRRDDFKSRKELLAPERDKVSRSEEYAQMSNDVYICDSAHLNAAI